MIIAGERADNSTSLEVQKMSDDLVITMDYHRARVGGGTYVKDGFGMIVPTDYAERYQIVRNLADALGVEITIPSKA